MKIIALSNFYPPNHLGGEALSAKAIVDGLRERGHAVEVVTSNHGNGQLENHVHPEFQLEMEFQPLIGAVRSLTKRDVIIENNKRVLEEYVQNTQPDLILIFSMWNIPREIPAYAEYLLENHVVYRLASYWPFLPSQHNLYWTAPARSWLTKIPKNILRRFALSILHKNPIPSLQLKHTICISQEVQDEYTKNGFALPDFYIIHNGIDVSKFINKNPLWINGKTQNPTKLLYVGRISPEKGVDTAIEAMAVLHREHPEITLSLVGSAKDDQELNRINALIEEMQLRRNIFLLGSVPYDDIPNIMWNHQILIVPSIWAEPFGRVVLEGMAAGMVVIGTGQGGMSAALKDNVTGLIFPPSDSEKLSYQIKRVLMDRSLGKELSKAGFGKVITEFTEAIMVDAYESCLLNNISEYPASNS
jgi:glycosyltransferase involved in cell wall biosynthesis